MKILVTGSNGYIGSKLIKVLASKHKIVKFDKKESSVKNLNNKKILNSIFTKNKIDLVIHLAALAGVEKEENNYLNYFNNNIKGTFNLLEAMRDHGVNKILFASSCSVYGSNDNSKEEDKLNPESFYGLTKIIGEHMIQIYAKKHNFKYNIFRIFNTIGNGANSKFNKTRIIPNLINKIQNNKEINLFLRSDSQKTCVRDYVDIEFVCKVFIKFSNNQTNSILNIGSGQGYSGEYIAKKLFTILNKTSNINYMIKRNGDPDTSISNNSNLIKNKINDSGRSLDQIIKECI